MTFAEAAAAVAPTNAFGASPASAPVACEPELSAFTSELVEGTLEETTGTGEPDVPVSAFPGSPPAAAAPVPCEDNGETESDAGSAAADAASPAGAACSLGIGEIAEIAELANGVRIAAFAAATFPCSPAGAEPDGLSVDGAAFKACPGVPFPSVPANDTLGVDDERLASTGAAIVPIADVSAGVTLDVAGTIGEAVPIVDDSPGVAVPAPCGSVLLGAAANASSTANIGKAIAPITAIKILVLRIAFSGW
ncbi:hypothetical protein [Paraburkholderia caribensis]|uniref:hypothetical protein n=1 Tax=Paraburkholderia caribensis TaxID=75105 RepID=UPI001CC4206B|nr:hypothetical protein [Paraburkholderia caribensis]